MIMVVILNKNNAEGLRRCLESLARQTLRICKDFEVLIMDGGSTDNSKEVAKEFNSKYPCIYFVRQWSGKGTGPARNDALQVIKSKFPNCNLVVWGDSENIYESTYLEELKKRTNECLLVGGEPIVDGKSVIGKSLFWYHTFYAMAPFLSKYHIAGNNLMAKLKVYEVCGEYPPIFRADDLYWNEVCRNKGMVFCLEKRAKVYVGVPEGWRDIMRWERARVRGLIEGGKFLGVVTRDVFRWVAFLTFYIVLAILTLINPTVFLPSLIASIAVPSIILEIYGHRYVRKPFVGIGFTSFLMMLVHSALTTVLYIKYRLVKSK